MAERKTQPVEDPSSGGKKGPGATEGTPKPPRRAGRPSQMDKVEERLNETFAALAMAQASLTLLTEDDRHDAAAEATMAHAPALVHSWCRLAEHNPRVRAILVRMTEGSAWGEVTIASLTFLIAQAQAYDLITWNPFQIPQSPEVSDHQAAQNGAPGPVPSEPTVPPTGRSAEDARSGVDAHQDPAHNEAEAQRRAVEQRRMRRGS